MSNIRVFWRYFLVHQDAAQEAWLEEQARRGLHLVRPGIFRHAFTMGETREVKYRLDFRTLRGQARREYLELFDDAGWEFVGQVANRYYFRARPDSIAPEIFSDAESRSDRIRRQMMIVGAITALLAFQTTMGITQLLARIGGEQSGLSMNGAVILILLAGSFGILGIWLLIQLSRAYRRERYQL